MKTKYETPEELFESNYVMFDSDVKKALFLGGSFVKALIKEMGEYYVVNGTSYNHFEDQIWYVLEGQEFNYDQWLFIMNLCADSLAKCRICMLEIENYNARTKDFTHEIERFNHISELGINANLMIGGSSFVNGSETDPQLAKHLFYLGMQVDIFNVNKTDETCNEV